MQFACSTGMGIVSEPVRAAFRGFTISQYDLPGSKTSCTAIAVVAAKFYLDAQGQTRFCMSTHDQVMEILAKGVVMHSRWLAAGQGSRVPYGCQKPGEESDTSSDDCDSDKPMHSMATADEICDLPGLGVEATATCYAGYLSLSCPFGKTVEESIREIFSAENLRSEETKAFILTTKGYSTMIGRRGSTAVVFDSHRRSPIDGLAVKQEREGGAVLVYCPNAEILITYLKTLYAARNEGALYTLQEVALHVDDTPTPQNVSLTAMLSAKTQQFRESVGKTIGWPFSYTPSRNNIDGHIVRIAV